MPEEKSGKRPRETIPTTHSVGTSMVRQRGVDKSPPQCRTAGPIWTRPLRQNYPLRSV